MGVDGEGRTRCGIGVTLHEAAHHVDRLLPRLARPEPSATQAHGHGHDWMRAALHLHHRVRAIVPLEALRIDTSSRGLSPAVHYRLCLARELDQLESLPVSAVLRTEPPAPFTALWRDDLDRLRRGRAA